MNDQPRTPSRRSFIKGAAMTGLATTALTALPSLASARSLAPGSSVASARLSRRRVAIFGAGMAGLATAHELIERGFEVHVFERRIQLGGKARSWGVPGTARGRRQPLPAEHGFRFFPGFYQNVPDHMARIPRPDRHDTVYQSLRGLDQFEGFGLGTTTGPGRSLGVYVPYNSPTDLTQLADPAYLTASVTNAIRVLAGVPAGQLPTEMADFTAKAMVYLTSCDQRRHTQWDHITWWDYLDAGNKSTFFQQAVVKGTTEDLVAVKAQKCAVDSAGNVIEAFTWNIAGYHSGPYTAPVLRFLDGPTSEVWLDYWTAHLRRLGVVFHPGNALTRLEVANRRIRSAVVKDQHGRNHVVEADWFVSALPIDKAIPVLTRTDVLHAAPGLASIRDLTVDWMNGMQIYLRKPPTHIRGVIGTIDHPWTLSAVTQSLLWKADFPATFGDGTVGECISIDISDWTNGVGTTWVGKAARDCTREEVFREIWDTLKTRFGAEEPAFSDDNLHSWYLDPAIMWSHGTYGNVTNDEPLTVQTPGTWAKRPSGPTQIPNLFIGGDWIQNGGNVACMEAGNLTGRIVAQAVLEASGSTAAPVEIFDRLAPPQMDYWKRLDQKRLAQGQPNLFEGVSMGTGVLSSTIEDLASATGGSSG